MNKIIKIIIGIVAVLFIIFSLTIVIMVMSMPDVPKLNEFGENYKIDKIMACVMAQSFVEPYLKSPGSADFQNCGGYDKANTNYAGDQIYGIVGYVDAQNSFGALIRVRYIVEITDNQDNTWHLNDIEIW